MSGRPRPALKIRTVGAIGTAESVRIHDLKNLACRLGALVQNLAEHYDDPLFKQSAIDVLHDTVEQMNRMVIRYRQPQSRTIVKLKINLNDLVARIVREVRRGAVPGVQISEDYAQIPPIWGEEYYLRSALLSIIVNAIEAMPAGGTLTLRTRRARKDGHAVVVVEIEDTGAGMTRTFVRQSLFSPFSTTKPGGLGLGLYNARQVVDLHGGAIEVRSVPSRGTLFRLRFRSADEHSS